MSKKNRERRTGDGGAETTGGGGGATAGMSWLPLVLAGGALVLGLAVWTDGKRSNDALTKRLGDIDQRISQLQTQVVNAAKARPAPQQGPDPNKVYPVKTDVGPTKGNPTAPIVIAEFSDYQ